MAKKEAKANNKENAKNKKSFWKSFKAELKKVNWPTPKQLFNNTVAVLAIVIITAIIVFALDFTFKAMNEHGINKIKQVVSNTTNSVDNEVVEENVENNEASNNEIENTENVE